MKKIGFIQVDGDYPNLALMQLSAYHEAEGDAVEWYKGSLFDEEYHSIYASKIFSFSEWPEGMPARTIRGGTGIDFKNTLPAHVAEFLPSYTLYPKCNYHIGFSMKGCRFNCKFCCVPQKEGRPKVNSSIDELLRNPRGQTRLMLLDNDFFGGENWDVNLERIIDLKLKVCFIQGLNIRIITQKQAELLANVNYTNSRFNQKYLTFAWDRIYDRKHVMKGIEICNAAGIPNNHMQFFVLIGFDSSPAQDYERVMTLRDLGCMPFVMPYKKDDAYQKSFARWVNNRAVFKSCTWEEYKYRSEVANA